MPAQGFSRALVGALSVVMPAPTLLRTVRVDYTPRKVCGSALASISRVAIEQTPSTPSQRGTTLSLFVPDGRGAADSGRVKQIRANRVCTAAS